MTVVSVLRTLKIEVISYTNFHVRVAEPLVSRAHKGHARDFSKTLYLLLPKHPQKRAPPGARPRGRAPSASAASATHTYVRTCKQAKALQHTPYSD